MSETPDAPRRFIPLVPLSQQKLAQIKSIITADDPGDGECTCPTCVAGRGGHPASEPDFEREEVEAFCGLLKVEDLKDLTDDYIFDLGETVLNELVRRGMLEFRGEPVTRVEDASPVGQFGPFGLA